jgi:HK97 gp10 family phage protein
MTTMRLQGAAEVEALLRKLPDKVAKKVVVSSLRQGGNVIVKQAKANLAGHGSIVTGALAGSIKTITVRNPTMGAAQVKVGVVGKKLSVVRPGETKPRRIGPGTYAKWVEYGAGEHRIEAEGKTLAWGAGGSTVFTRTVDHPGAKAKPFIRPAVDTKGAAAAQKVVSAAAKGIAREAGKLAG